MNLQALLISRFISFFISTILLFSQFNYATNIWNDYMNKFLENCKKYQADFNDPFGDCYQVWFIFCEPFKTSVDTCIVDYTGFKYFWENITTVIPKNKGILWSGPGTSNIGDRCKLEGNKASYISLVCTRAGFMSDGVEWWKGNRNCSYPEALYKFWCQLSTLYLESLTGIVNVILQGKTGLAYNKSSIFATCEVPFMKSERINQVNVKMINASSKENCNTGSLIELKHEIEEKSIKFTCEESNATISCRIMNQELIFLALVTSLFIFCSKYNILL